jgi:hypothetical protein
MNNSTVWRVDLDTDKNDYRTRKQYRATSMAHAEAIYSNFLAWPLDGYETVTLVADCRIQRKQMLHGNQEHIS